MSQSSRLDSEPEISGSEEVATGIVARLVDAGVDLSLDGDDVAFKGPPQALGEETLDELRHGKEAIVSLLRRNRARGVLKLGATSREQCRMEWRSRADRHAATYNVCLRLDLRGAVRPHRLRQVVDALVERHEILRTRFAWYGDHLLQEVVAPPRAVLQILEPTVLFGADDKQLADWCSRRGAMAFDLAAEAPARWCYAPIEPRRGVLLITFHHIACDGWSIERLLDELRALFAETPEDPSPLPPVTVTPCAFARWESNWLTEERLESERAFWKDELRDTALAPVLKRSKSTAEPGGDADCVVRTIAPDVVNRLQDVARTLAISEFSLYFAAFAMLLNEETDVGDFAVVIAVLNRTRPEHEEVFGLCRNALPVRCSVRQGDSIDCVARNISARVERVLEKQWFPISLIAAPDAREAIDIRRLPLTFGFEGPSDSTIDCPEFQITLHDVYLGAARAEYSLLVRRRTDAAEAFFEYSKTLLSSEDAETLAERYVQLITAEIGQALGGRLA